MTADDQPRTEAGRRLGVDVEQELGLQTKSREAYHGWLRTANHLAIAIEEQAVAAERERHEATRRVLAYLWTATGYRSGSLRVCDLFTADDPLAVDVRALLAEPAPEEAA